MPAWTAADPVALHARGQPHRPACTDLATGRRWTYAELDADIQRGVAVLGALGIAPGQRVAALAHNGAGLLLLQQACARRGAIFVPVNWRLSPVEQRVILADCQPSLMVHDMVVDAVPDRCTLLPMEDFAARLQAAAPVAPNAMPAMDAPSILLYTSGTSGRPKGVVVTEGNALATAMNFGVLGRVDHRSVFLCDAPMFHVMGLITSLRAPLLAGGAVLLSPGFDPIVTNARLADPALGVTHYFCVPQMARRLREAANFAPAQWTGLVALFTGGAPNPAQEVRWWLDRGVCMADGFGMTEAGTVLGMPPEAGRIASKAGASGLPGPAMMLRLVDGDEREVGLGEPGEIWIAGPSVTPGYWNLPEETARAFTSDGWFRTGDIGQRDAEGFVTLMDRRKDMFISGGENVYPAEVEAVLTEHPAVADAAVLGVPDAQWGEVGRAFVVLREKEPRHQDLVAHCAARLARYKIPKEFVFVDALPRTASGKLQKHLLRQEYPPG
jgi:fatty-acyl-CoA synthase